MGNREIHEALAGLHAGPEMHRMAERMRDFAGGPGFGPRGWAGFGRRPGGRMRRGGMPTAILALLVEHPMHGYQIIQELATRSGGAWAPGAGSVYPALEQMEVQGLVTGEQQDDKRVYSITDKGRELAQHSQRHGHAPWDEAAEASGPRVDLRQSVMSLFQAAEQVGRTGTDVQISKVVELVDQARKQVYLILAE